MLDQQHGDAECPDAGLCQVEPFEQGGCRCPQAETPAAVARVHDDARQIEAVAGAVDPGLADAESGDVDALFELGLTYSTGRGGIAVDLIEAHKWFNLAALSGSTRGQECRAEIALEMTAREIAEAQRQARAWLATTSYQRRAA